MPPQRRDPGGCRGRTPVEPPGSSPAVQVSRLPRLVVFPSSSRSSVGPSSSPATVRVTAERTRLSSCSCSTTSAVESTARWHRPIDQLRLVVIAEEQAHRVSTGVSNAVLAIEGNELLGSRAGHCPCRPAPPLWARLPFQRWGVDRSWLRLSRIQLPAAGVAGGVQGRRGDRFALQQPLLEQQGAALSRRPLRSPRPCCSAAAQLLLCSFTQARGSCRAMAKRSP